MRWQKRARPEWDRIYYRAEVCLMQQLVHVQPPASCYRVTEGHQPSHGKGGMVEQGRSMRLRLKEAVILKSQTMSPGFHLVCFELGCAVTHLPVHLYSFLMLHWVHPGFVCTTLIPVFFLVNDIYATDICSFTCTNKSQKEELRAEAYLSPPRSWPAAA